MEYPFDLQLGQSVTARVLATNDVGSSPFSDPGNGSVIVIWYVPDAPVSLANDGSVTTRTQIKVDWQDAANDGGKAVLDYRISYDKGEGQDVFYILYSGITE